MLNRKNKQKRDNGEIMDRKVYSEVFDIIKVMDEKYKDKIPKEVIDYVAANRDIFYETNIKTFPKIEDNLLYDTKVFMTMIYRNYIKNTDVDISELKKKKIILENKIRKNQIQNMKIENNTEKLSNNLQMIEVKENKFDNFIKFIKNIWSNIKKKI